MSHEHYMQPAPLSTEKLAATARTHILVSEAAALQAPYFSMSGPLNSLVNLAGISGSLLHRAGGVQQTQGRQRRACPGVLEPEGCLPDRERAHLHVSASLLRHQPPQPHPGGGRLRRRPGGGVGPAGTQGVQLCLWLRFWELIKIGCFRTDTLGSSTLATDLQVMFAL